LEPFWLTRELMLLECDHLFEHFSPFAPDVHQINIKREYKVLKIIDTHKRNDHKNKMTYQKKLPEM
jgi:hypothetical protein